MTTEGFSAKRAARELGIEARILRKFLRSDASPFEPVGQGQRYVFDTEDMKVLKKAFADTHPKKAVRKVHYHEPEEIDLVPEPDRSEEAEAWEAEHELDLDDLEEPTEEQLRSEYDLEEDYDTYLSDEGD